MLETIDEDPDEQVNEDCVEEHAQASKGVLLQDAHHGRSCCIQHPAAGTWP